MKPGGRLVYITCSVFREENHDQIAVFLAANPEFSAVDHGELIARRLRGQSNSVRIEADCGIMLSPLSSGTDGFYFAALQRAA